MQTITYSSVEDIRPGTVHKNHVKNQTQHHINDPEN